VWKNEVSDLMDQIGGVRQNCGYSTFSLNDLLTDVIEQVNSESALAPIVGAAMSG
jgi:hypothetical protein